MVFCVVLPLLVSQFYARNNSGPRGCYNKSSYNNTYGASYGGSRYTILDRHLSRSLTRGGAGSTSQRAYTYSHGVGGQFMRSSYPRGCTYSGGTHGCSYKDRFYFIGGGLAYRTSRSTGPRYVCVLRASASFILSLSVGVIPDF